MRKGERLGAPRDGDGNQRTYGDIQIDTGVNRDVRACGSVRHRAPVSGF